MRHDMTVLLMTEFKSLNLEVYAIGHQRLNACTEVKIDNKKTCNDLSTVVAHTDIKHDHFVNATETKSACKNDAMIMRSLSHEIYTFEHQKNLDIVL